MLVPLSVLVSVSEAMPTERTLTPGAKMSTPLPKLEKLARASFLASMAPTVMALGAEPGDVLAVSCCDSGSASLSVNRCLAVSTYVLIASSNDGHDAGVADGLDGAVQCLGEGSAEGHVHDGLALDAALLDVVDDELHAVEDGRVLASPLGVEDLDSHDLGLLGNAKGGAGDGARDVAAVALLVRVDVVDKVGGKGGAALELAVGDADAGCRQHRQ